MDQLTFSPDLLDAEVPKLKRQLSWAYKNMLKYEQGSHQAEIWFERLLHLGLQIDELTSMKDSAASEPLVDSDITEYEPEVLANC